MCRPLLLRRLNSTMAAPPSVAFPKFKNPLVQGYTLARPKALNSLNEDMVALLRPRVEKWVQSAEPRVILARGEGRGFCAGGDVKGE